MTPYFFRETFSKKISKPFDFHFYTSVTTFLCMMVPGKGRRLVCSRILLHGMGPLTPASHPPQACLVAGKKPAQKCFMFRGRSVPDTKARLQAAAPCPLCPTPMTTSSYHPWPAATQLVSLVSDRMDPQSQAPWGSLRTTQLCSGGWRARRGRQA